MARSKRFKRDAVSMDDGDVIETPSTVVVEVEEDEPNVIIQEPHVDAEPEAPKKDEGDEEKPLEVLRRQLEDERRRAQDLEQYAHQKDVQLTQQQYASQQGTRKAVLEQAYETEELRLSDAKRRHQVALETNDFETATNAQQDMIRINGIMQQYATEYNWLTNQNPAQQAQPQRQTQQVSADPFEDALRQMDPRVAAWAREHKDDVVARQNVALEADFWARSKGLKPGEDAYLDYMDDAMGYDGEPTQVISAPKSQRKASVSAPSSRMSSGSSRKREVTLTEDDLRQAQGYGVTPEEYARWKLASESDEKLNSGSRSKLHFKAISR